MASQLDANPPLSCIYILEREREREREREDLIPTSSFRRRKKKTYRR